MQNNSCATNSALIAPSFKSPRHHTSRKLFLKWNGCLSQIAMTSNRDSKSVARLPKSNWLYRKFSQLNSFTRTSVSQKRLTSILRTSKPQHVSQDITKHFPFLHLPQELRDEIYWYCLDYNDGMENLFTFLKENVKKEMINGTIKTSSPRAMTPNVLLLNRQITAEALQILRKKPLVLLAPMPFDLRPAPNGNNQQSRLTGGLFQSKFFERIKSRLSRHVTERTTLPMIIMEDGVYWVDPIGLMPAFIASTTLHNVTRIQLQIKPHPGKYTAPNVWMQQWLFFMHVLARYLGEGERMHMIEVYDMTRWPVGNYPSVWLVSGLKSALGRSVKRVRIARPRSASSKDEINAICSAFRKPKQSIKMLASSEI